MMRKESVVGFVGKVERLELQHIIQIACLSGTTATIVVRQRNQKGYLYVRNGQILHAVVGGLQGQEAVNEMVGWRVGRFELKHGISRRIPRTLTSSSTSVILEATRILDERLAESEAEFSGVEDKIRSARSLQLTQGAAGEILQLISKHRKRREWRFKLAIGLQAIVTVLAVGSLGYFGFENRARIIGLLKGVGRKPVLRVDFGGPIEIPAGLFYYQNGQSMVLPRFDIDSAEVTIWQYAEFLAAIGESHEYDHPDQPVGRGHRNSQWDQLYKAALAQGEMEGEQININFPAVFIDWFDAYAYAKWKGRRLPTEEEWEKAARGPRGQRYSWGPEDRVGSANVYHGDARQKWVPPGRYPEDKSPYGVWDMTGNVSEWTSSVDQSGNPVIRGGNFGNYSTDVTRRVTNQGCLTISDRIGFRTVSER